MPREPEMGITAVAAAEPRGHQLQAIDGSPLAPSLPSASDPMGLLHLALDKGVDVAVIERLVDLAERVGDRNARAAFFAAKSAFQEEVPEIRRTKRAGDVSGGGAKFGFAYAPLEEIARTIRPALTKHGLSYSWDVGEGEKSGNLMVTCVLRHIDGHEDRASFPVPVDTGAKMSAAQRNGAALTYGRRQSLIAVLGLTTADEDNDAAQAQQHGAEVITDRQVADLRTLIKSVGANRQAFLKFMNVDDEAKIARHAYPIAIATLEQKRRAE